MTEPEVRPLPERIPLLTQRAIERALATVPTESKSAVIAFTTDGKGIEGVVAARLNEHWSFVTMISHDLAPKGETVGTAVVRFDW